MTAGAEPLILGRGGEFQSPALAICVCTDGTIAAGFGSGHVRFWEETSADAAAAPALGVAATCTLAGVIVRGLAALPDGDVALVANDGIARVLSKRGGEWAQTRASASVGERRPALRPN